MTEKTSASLFFCCHLLGCELVLCREPLGCQAYSLVTLEVSISTLKRTRISKSKLYKNVHNGFVHLSSKLELTHMSVSSGWIKMSCFIHTHYTARRGLTADVWGSEWRPQTLSRRSQTQSVCHTILCKWSPRMCKSSKMSEWGRPHCTGPRPLLWCWLFCVLN